MPLSRVVEDGLRDYAIGEKLRALRHQKKMGLVALARHSGFSAGLLSKIERGRVFPPLGTLLRIAMVFGVGLDYFFVDERRHHVVSVVRKAERKRFPDDPDARRASYRFESLDFPATERASSAYLAEFEPGTPGRVRRHQHAGAETIYVLSGTLVLEVGPDAFELKAGDSVYFDSEAPHGYRRLGASPCRAVVFTVP